jgi:predicted aspartyl protease
MRWPGIVVVGLFFAACGVARGECTIPLESTRTAFVTDVRVGSSGVLRFLVDTGATTTVVDRSVAQRIGLQASRTIAAVSTTGSLDAGEAIVPEIRAGNLSAFDTPVLIADLPTFSSHGRLDGILGMSFFAGRSVLLDLSQRCAEVGIAAPHGTLLPAREVAGRIAMEIDGLQFVLDSGASFPVLRSARARARASVEATAEVTSAAGRRRMTTAILPVLHIGPRTIRDVTVAIAPDVDPREDGLLPATFFSRIYIAADRKSVVVN